MTYLRNLWIAIESGWRAGVKQFRHRRTQLRNQATRPITTGASQ